ncbi:MAG: hypothetical protein JJU10_07810 [Idiomarina sp.]|nr:hypothetical protein [Idiomarina sp.]
MEMRYGVELEIAERHAVHALRKTMNTAVGDALHRAQPNPNSTPIMHFRCTASRTAKPQIQRRSCISDALHRA